VYKNVVPPELQGTSKSSNIFVASALLAVMLCALKALTLLSFTFESLK
jgi:hypothetical protein